MAAPRPTASAMGGVPASNFQGSSLGSKPSRRTSLIIEPPPRKGGISSSRDRRPHSTPIPVGPSILWPVNPTRSAPRAATSVGRWGTYWAPSATTIAPALEVVQHQVAMVVDPEVAQLEALLLGQDQPGNQIGVVLHLGEHHGVPWAEVGPAPAARHQVERLGDVLGEQHLLGRWRPDEAGHLGPRPLEEGVRLLGYGVDAPVDVGMGGLVVVVHGVQHGPRPLRGGGRVQVDEGLAGHGPVEYREVLLQALDV